MTTTETESFEKYYESLTNLQGELEDRLHAIERDLHRRSQPVSANFSEQATEMENAEVLEGLYDEGREELTQVKAALHRLETEAFGRCLKCGINISVQRLEALPYAEQCRDCVEQS